MNMMQTATGVTLGEKGLTLTLPEGRPAYFNYYWLRDNCPRSFNATTRERTFDIFHLDAPPRAEAARIAGDTLVIDWAGEAHVTVMPLAVLSAYAAGTRRPDPADLPRRAWYGPALPRRVARHSRAGPGVRWKRTGPPCGRPRPGPRRPPRQGPHGAAGPGPRGRGRAGSARPRGCQ